MIMLVKYSFECEELLEDLRVTFSVCFHAVIRVDGVAVLIFQLMLIFY